MFICSCCNRSTKQHKIVKCNFCKKPFNIDCVNVTVTEALKIHRKTGLLWSCKICLQPEDETMEIETGSSNPSTSIQLTLSDTVQETKAIVKTEPLETNWSFSMSIKSETRETTDISANGGFMNDNDNQQGSASKKKEQVKRVQSLVPLFISYIVESPDEEFTLYGMPVQMVDIVGVVRNFDVQSTKATCVIEDHSGVIQAILWFESDGDSMKAVPPVKENCYVRIYGTIRTQDGEKMIMIIKIIPIDDLNVVTNHHLQALYARLYAEKLSNGTLPSACLENNTTMSMNNGPISFNDVKINGGQENPHGLNPIQFKIMKHLKSCHDQIGLTKEDIMGKFESGQARDVRSTLDFLLDEGYVYTTVDNDHFKATDGF